MPANVGPTQTMYASPCTICITFTIARNEDCDVCSERPGRFLLIGDTALNSQLLASYHSQMRE